jgi:hypothetical protein
MFNSRNQEIDAILKKFEQDLKEKNDIIQKKDEEFQEIKSK